MIGIGVFVVMVIVVASLAGGAGFIVGRSRAAVAEEQARSWRESAEQMRRERDASGEQSRQERDSAVEEARRERDAAVAQVRAERDVALGQVQRERADAADQLAKLRGQLQDETTARTTAQTELAALRERRDEELAALRARHDEELALVRGVHTDMKEVSTQLTTEALNAAGAALVKQFTDLAEQRAQATARELDKRESSFEEMVKPVVALIDKTSAQMAEVSKENASAKAALGEQLKQMSTDRDMVRMSSNEVLKEIGQLKNVFRRPEARGQWGEQTLQAVVEASGMTNLINFDNQPTFNTDDGAQRPDLIVNISRDMAVVVDAKASFNALIDAANARDEAEQQQRLAVHAKNVRTHIDQLAAKKYWLLPNKSPEFVVMFVPSDSFLYAAWEQDRGLWEYAANKKVILATPTSLLVILQSAAAVLRYDKAATNLQSTVDTCKELVKRLAKLAEHVGSLGVNLGKTVQNFNSVVGCLEQRVLPQGRRVNELQGGEASIRELDTVDLTPRQIAGSRAELDGDSTSAA
ncbi:DNA recombination protein RmuC [Nocardia beijingensis]|uniref:DNA recombination protein RmuC n=1 Tax=Nocardia beijingensis TaxID=95162 RepID=UPI00344DEC27